MTENREITKLKDQLETIKTQRDKAEKEHQSESKRLNDECHQQTQDNFRLKKQIAELASTVNELETMT